MEAGPEMDRLVAEKVMGWRDMSWAERYPNDAEDTGFMPRQWYGPLPDGRLVGLYNVSEHDHDSPNSLWRPSVNIAHAWELMEKVRNDGWHVVVVTCDGCEPGSDGPWAVDIVRRNQGAIAVHANTAPLAICRAALMALKPEGE